MVVPHVSYCAIIWANASVTHIKKRLIQKRALRSVVLARKVAPSKPNFHRLHRLTIFNEYKLQVALFMFNVLKGTMPHLLKIYFNVNSEIHG